MQGKLRARCFNQGRSFLEPLKHTGVQAAL